MRKTETNGQLRADSLELLANALGTKDMPLHARDLTSDLLPISQAYMRSYLQHGADSARLSAALFAPDVVMAIHTDDPNLQFSGDLHGVDAIEKMIRYAYTQFDHVNGDFGRWSVNGKRAVAMCKEVLRAAGNVNAPCCTPESFMSTRSSTGSSPASITTSIRPPSRDISHR